MLRGMAFSCLTGGSSTPLGFKLIGETPVQSGVGLGVWRLFWVREATQEVGWRNYPPCLINRLFPKSAHALIGVVDMSDHVSVYLQDLNSR